MERYTFLAVCSIFNELKNLSIAELSQTSRARLILQIAQANGTDGAVVDGLIKHHELDPQAHRAHVRPNNPQRSPMGKLARVFGTARNGNSGRPKTVMVPRSVDQITGNTWTGRGHRPDWLVGAHADLSHRAEVQLCHPAER